MPRPAKQKPDNNGANLGFEAQLWLTADKLRNNMESSNYKHIVLGLIFLKHISDSFETQRAALLAEYPDGAEDPDEYRAENIFWVPKDARAGRTCKTAPNSPASASASTRPCWPSRPRTRASRARCPRITPARN